MVCCIFLQITIISKNPLYVKTKVIKKGIYDIYKYKNYKTLAIFVFSCYYSIRIKCIDGDSSSATDLKRVGDGVSPV